MKSLPLPAPSAAVLAVLTLGTAPLTAACGPDIHLADSVDLSLDFHPLTGPSDRLHSPYVRGASFDVWAHDGEDDDDALRGWSLVTSDQDTLAVDDQLEDGDDVRARVTATGEGHAVITVLDDDRHIAHDATVEVVVPDRAEVLAHGPLIVGRPDLPTRVEAPKVLVGGRATFLVRWYDGARRLGGNGALEVRVDDPAAVDATARRSFLFEDRDWLTVEVSEPGRHTVHLLADGVPVRPLEVVGVVEGEVDHVLIHGEDESAADRDEWLAAVAQAYDVEGEPIYGVEYTWELDGVGVEGVEHGDLLRYQFAPGWAREVCARHEEKEARARLHAGETYVDSTNDIGCATLPGGSTPGYGALLLLGLVALARRRSGAVRGGRPTRGRRGC